MMEITILGSSAGIPTRARNVSGAVIAYANAKEWWLVDCGEGTQHQILKTRFSLARLKAIFITHVHGDHCYGLPGLLSTMSMSNRKEKLIIYAPKGVEKFVNTALDCSQSYIPYPLEFVEVQANKLVCETENISVSSCELSHRVPCFAYSFKERVMHRALDTEKLVHHGIAPGPFYGDLQKGRDITLEDGSVIEAENFLLPSHRPRKIIVSGDNDSPDMLKNEVDDVDVLIHEATFTEEILKKVGKGPQHCSAKQIAEFSQATNVPNLLLTHFSARYAYARGAVSHISEIHTEAVKYYDGNLMLAEDLVSYSLSRAGVLQASKSTDFDRYFS